MKKSLLVLFTILVLVLAVSCNSDFFGKIEIDTSEIEIPEGAASVQLAFTTEYGQSIKYAGYPLSFKDVEKGRVRVVMPVGYYEEMYLAFYDSEDVLGSKFEVFERVRGTDIIAEGAVIVVDKGETTYCTVLVQQ